MKALLFDIDGTLLDTREFILQTYERVLKKHNGPVFERSELIKHVGGGSLITNYPKILPGMDVQILMQDHKDIHAELLHLIVSYKDVHDVLTTLKKKYKVAAVTGRTKKSAYTNMKNHGLTDYFEFITTAEDVKNPKPDPEGIIQALSFFKIQPHEALMIGDADSDIEAGKRAGVKTVAITHGFFDREYLSKYEPDYIIDTLPELLSLCEESESN